MAKLDSLRAFLHLTLLGLCVGEAFAGLSQGHKTGDPGASSVLGLGDGGLGPPISAWYFSLKTSKGYCGLVPLSTAAGGYGFAISCANKYPVYDSQFTLLSAEAPPASLSGVSGWADAAVSKAAGTSTDTDSDMDTEVVGDGLRRATASVAEAGEQGLPAQQGLLYGLHLAEEAEAGQVEGQPERRGSMTDEALRVRRLLSGAADPRVHTEPDAAVSGAGTAANGDSNAPRIHDPNAPVVVVSGTPLRLLSRSAGLCGSVPTPGRASLQQQEREREEPPHRPAPGSSWYAWLQCRVLPALQCALNALSRTLRLPQPLPLSPPAACGTAGGAAGRGATQAPRVGDTAPWPVTCVLAQPGSLQWRLFKSDLKDNATVDLAADWLYLMEGDKYCTLADVAGMTAVVSCHLESPGWTGYKFQLQTLSYPRSQLASQLTGGDCSVRLPSLPPPHDWACGGPGQPPAPDRSPDFDLVLQTPGSALAAGVVVGITTYSHGLVGNQLQRCCPMTSSPHIIFCEIPAPGSVPPAECWFQLYDVKLARSLAGSREDPARLDFTDREGGGGGGTGGGWRGVSGGGRGSGRQSGGFWAAFARSLFEEMSPVGLPGMAADEESEGAHAGAQHVAAPGFKITVAGAEEEAEFKGANVAVEEELEEELEEEVGLVTELTAAAGRLRFPWDAVTPITDGSLVMFMSKAFARYCSVSVDGDLLCVSAQASNASRNLFTLRLPPLPQVGGTAAAGAAGQFGGAPRR